MNLRFLETFVWLARLRSFRLTAERLHATQAAISSRISALEQEMGVRLFERGPKEATLTHDGTKALPFAEQMLKLNQEMLTSVGDRSKVSGLARLGAIESVVHTWLPDLLKRIRDEYPNLVIEFTSDTSSNLTTQLMNGHIDVSFQMTSAAGPDVANLTLGSLPMRWIASPTLNLSAQTLTESELAAFPVITFARHSPPHEFLESLFGASGDIQAQINCLSSVAAIIRLVVDGFGIAVLPPAFVMRELETAQLQLLQVTHWVPPLQLLAAYRRTADNLISESIARLALNVMLEFSLKHGPEFALFPTTDPAVAPE
jgi:DNA-binding transcriptional LysR family regulator